MKENTKKNTVRPFERINHTFLQAIGSRIMCELNDLKRTLESATKELSVPIKELHRIIKGCSTWTEPAYFKNHPFSKQKLG